MTRRKMRKSHFVACLPVFASLASAQLNFPNCTSGWDWSYNSLGQNPCNVAAYLESTCGTGLFSIPPLSDGSLYGGPEAGQDSDNLCECNTIVYSLVSACGACQGSSSWIQWSQWRLNCSTVSAAGTYPNPIPDGTRIPHWAYLDVSVADTWNISAAQSAGDSPEGTPSTASTVSASSTSGSSSSTSPSSSSNKKSSSTGAIAGGVVGGVVGVTLVVGLIIWYIRRRRWRSVARPSPFMTDSPHMAEAFGAPDHTTPPIPKYYDPSDPSTFPTSLASPSATVIQTTPGSEQAHGTLTPPISVNDRNRYTGLPIV